MPPPISRLRTRGRLLAIKLLLALSSAAMTVFVLEFGARRLLVDPGIEIWVPNPCVQWNLTLGQEFKPNCSSTLAATDFRTNSIGLRGDEVADDDSVRILALGDSCTWGWGVAEGESYPAFLQRTLDYDAGAHRYQILNAGVPGFTSYQGLVYLRERGASLHPQLVLIGYGFNDQTTSGDIREYIERSRLLQPLFRLDELMGRSSVLYRWVRFKFHRPPVFGLAPRVPLDEYGPNLEAIVKLAREMGARPVLVGFLPEVHPYTAAERDVAARLGVPLVRYQGPRLDVIHPTAKGYGAFVRKLYEQLRSEGYL